MAYLTLTDKNIQYEHLLVEKIKLMVERSTKDMNKDNCLIIEGSEGEGKTTMGGEVAYLYATLADRLKKFTNGKLNANTFFDGESMFNFAINTEDQIIIWDEPALDALSTDWWNETQKNIIKMLMMARKKRHFFIFCFTRLNKFSEYIARRAIGMIRVYSYQETKPGYFVYYKKKALTALYDNWIRSKRMEYGKYITFHGHFKSKNALGHPIFETLWDETAYEKEKDNAILQIGKKKENNEKKLLRNLRHRVRNLSFPINTQKELAYQLKISPSALRRWGTPQENEEVGTLPLTKTIDEGEIKKDEGELESEIL